MNFRFERYCGMKFTMHVKSLLKLYNFKLMEKDTDSHFISSSPQFMDVSLVAQIHSHTRLGYNYNLTLER